jgi:hypothetical protein
MAIVNETPLCNICDWEQIYIFNAFERYDVNEINQSM